MVDPLVSAASLKTGAVTSIRPICVITYPYAPGGSTSGSSEECAISSPSGCHLFWLCRLRLLSPGRGLRLAGPLTVARADSQVVPDRAEAGGTAPRPEAPQRRTHSSARIPVPPPAEATARAQATLSTI